MYVSNIYNGIGTACILKRYFKFYWTRKSGVFCLFCYLFARFCVSLIDWI